ncbi:hypothetical protein [Vitiosangium sp. GDMCC 1.1324]|uniref:hypothetical protein n=1 Tax=Vitiosangium sp. (strain GDMCC 1.1324) TaxID=2138576 RepID=UPI0018EEA1BF|nr:hypothetical protein [Vitiosangium sp. GDMCC 1.1324]
MTQGAPGERLFGNFPDYTRAPTRCPSISNTLKDLAVLGLRHDIPDTAWAWGGELSYEFYSRDYRPTEVGRFWEGPVWDATWGFKRERPACAGLLL